MERNPVDSSGEKNILPAADGTFLSSKDPTIHHTTAFSAVRVCKIARVYLESHGKNLQWFPAGVFMIASYQPA
jgi:hypothetical protein